MSEPPWIWQYDHVVPSEIGAIGPVRREILQQLLDRNWSKRDLFSVHLALDEAMVNAVTHGNRLDPNKHIHVTCRMSPDWLEIEVADEGKGFDPAAVPDPTDECRVSHPGGRGVMLMRNFMDRVQFNERGNCVRLEKRRTPCDE
ncbi:MAG: ATP-binding protein [Pirellulales bacterium]|nr:ATP-binding protein [Pirellulales bacterium]